MIRRTLNCVLFAGIVGVICGTITPVRGESPFGNLATTRAAASQVGIESDVLRESGLGGLETLTDETGSLVRGLAGRGAGRASGMSFVAGMLYDPGTSSVLRGSNSNSTASSGGGARSEVAQYSLIMLGMTIRIDGVTTFNGSITGSAGGHGFAQP